ncbi:MAG: hydrogenase subunit MbhD domain-containing protein [Halofilum sp. (in: g-proteobacteria)]|nr:hydrogenase subunit MbhD domain-containing protein [Halofilum sp. (in: g-proteobacteria)]
MLPVFDTMLCLGLLWLGWGIVASTTLFRGVVLFMVFGLLMAVTWVRLSAPDVALAEAVIGAGIAGALLLGACKAMLSDPGTPAEQGGPEPAALPRLPAAALSLLVGAALAWLMVTVRGGGPVPEAVAIALPTHFLHNPVSVILLDLRGYDTLMETVVLLLAFLGARAMMRHSELDPLFTPVATHRHYTMPLITLLTPILLLLALHILWTGGNAPGGAFQAGALLAALGVMYQLTGHLRPSRESGPGVRALLVCGLLVFSLFACLGLTWGDAPLTYPRGAGYVSALVVEIALMLSIGTTLTLLFAAHPGLKPDLRQ